MYVVLRRFEDALHRSHFDNASAIHNGDAVGQVAHHAHVMADEHVGQRQPLLKILQQIEDLRLDGNVER